jgi:hypothetical protein
MYYLNSQHTVHARVFGKFVLFIPPTVNNQFATLRPTKCTMLVLFLRYLYYNNIYNIAASFDPQGIIIREPTKATSHRTKLAAFVHSRHGVKESDT